MSRWDALRTSNDSSNNSNTTNTTSISSPQRPPHRSQHSGGWSRGSSLRDEARSSHPNHTHTHRSPNRPTPSWQQQRRRNASSRADSSTESTISNLTVTPESLQRLQRILSDAKQQSIQRQQIHLKSSQDKISTQNHSHANASNTAQQMNDVVSREMQGILLQIRADSTCSRSSQQQQQLALSSEFRGEIIATVLELTQIEGMIDEGNPPGPDNHDFLHKACQFSSQLLDLSLTPDGSEDLVKPASSEKLASVKMTVSQLESCMKILKQESLRILQELQSTSDYASDGTNCVVIDSLVDFLYVFGDQQLGAEETANEIVNSILLPVVELSQSNNGDTDYQCYRLTAIRGLTTLMQCRTHASSILAPLVIDVSSEGKERHDPNPLRHRTLGALESVFLETNEDESMLFPIMRSLIVALNSIAGIEKGISSSSLLVSKKKHELNSSSMARRINDILFLDAPSKRSIRLCALSLLRAMTRTYPQSTATQWVVLLPEPGVTGSSRVGKGLLCMIESSQIAPDERICALFATKEFLEAMPLRLWLSNTTSNINNSTNNHVHHQTRTKPSFLASRHLSGRVKGSITQLFDVTIKMLQHTNNMYSCEELSVVLTLSGTIMANVPFYKDDTELVKSGVSLMSAIGDFIQRLGSDDSFSDDQRCKLLEAAQETMRISIGGTMTQQGTRTPMPLPTLKWFESAACIPFIDRLLDIGWLQQPHYREFALNTLCSVIRMAPWIATQTDERVETFLQLLDQLLAGRLEDTRLQGITLIESFLHGRHESLDRMTIEHDFVVRQICPMLYSALSDRGASIRSNAALGYGVIDPSDWKLLFDLKSTESVSLTGETHFDKVLSLCNSPHTFSQGCEENGSVRSAACKTIGQICSQCISKPRSQQYDKTSTLSSQDTIIDDILARHISQKVVDSMLASLQDSNGTVRSMVLFALGNVALAIKDRQSLEPLVTYESLLESCCCVSDSLGDSNDKVVGNAVRTIGHLSYLIFRSPFEESLLLTENGAILYQRVVSRLKNKITWALKDAEGTAPKMSWKQRSSAKKHAWGACHSLALILNSGEASRDTNTAASCAALDEMIHCVKKAQHLNDKITKTAIATLTVIPRDLWHIGAAHGGSVAYGITCCLQVSYKEKTNKDALLVKLADDIYSLLSFLLCVASDVDMFQSFCDETVTNTMVSFLYGWMIEHGCEASIFENISLALQTRILRDKYEVSVIQKFSSRALHEQRRELSPNKPIQEHETGHQIENEEDEL